MGVSTSRGSFGLIGASLLSLAIAAPQKAEAQKQDDDAVGEVVVTGSRITNVTGMSTPTPVTAVSAEELQQMSPGTLVSALSKLPQFYGNTNSEVVGAFFGSPGSGNLNLRGLNTGGASSRTLTLLDGRRIVPATSKGGVDTNILPESLVKRVDTVTGGASAAYGTDAVAGVVNFILDTEYTGWQLHAQSGATSRGDHDNTEFAATYGVALGERAHLLLNAEYYKADGVFGYDDRDWYQSWGTITNPATTGPRMLIRPNVVSAVSTFGGLIAGGVPATSALFRRQFNSDGSLSPFVLGEGTLSGGGTSHSITNGGSGDYIGADIQTISPDSRRGNGFLYVDFDATPNLNVYVQGLAGLSTIDQPDHGGRFNGGLSGAGTSLTIFRENAFLPAAVRQIMVNENLNSFQLSVTGDREGLGRESRVKQDNHTYAGTLGFKWKIDREGFLQGWHVDGYAQYGTADNTGYQQGIILNRVEAAIDAVVDPNNANNIVCRAALINPAKYGDCVPLNLFGRGNASDAAIAYVTRFNAGQQISTPLFINPDGYASGDSVTYTSGFGKVYNTTTEQRVAELATSGKIADGWGAGALSAAFGVAWRKEEIDQIVYDPSNPASDPNIFPAADTALRGVSSNIATRTSMIQNSTVPNIHGSYDVKEAFTEWQVPLLAEKPLVKQLNLLASGRYANYEGSGGIWAWKYGLDYQVIHDVRLRGTVSRDVRAATLSERFDQTGGFGSVTRDPQFPNDGQQAFTIRSGGNPTLAPEKADTRTFGVVYQPSWLQGVSTSVDYWDIDIAGAIGTLGLQRIVDDCFAGAEAMCALIRRDPTTQRLTQVINVSQNIAAAAGRGIDVEMGYNRPIKLFRDGSETMGARLFYSRLLENSTTSDPTNPATKVDLAGQTGSGGVLPKDSYTANLTYSNGPFDAFVQGRYIGKGIYNVRFNLPTAARPDIEDNTVSSAFYVDLRLGYSFEIAGGQLELYANALNLLDRDPPVVASWDGALAQTSSQVNFGLFDPLGRRYLVGFSFKY
jgi:outer membrane receptor protein involved in Fe transport